MILNKTNMNSYYDKNKERIKAQQREYYHKHKLDPHYSHYRNYRNNIQRCEYKKKHDNVRPQKTSIEVSSPSDFTKDLWKRDFNINHGSFSFPF